jgi:hypothetical protein
MGIKYQIIIEIDEDENVTMETVGFKGSKCVDEIKKVTQNIATIKSTKKTKEYYEKDQSKIKKKNTLFSK